jgi:hypothetical protein
MTEAHNSNNEDYSSETIHTVERASQDKEIIKVLEALESLWFRFEGHC